MMDVIETIDYRGFEIEIYPDMDPENPWTDWDGQPPLLVYSDGHESAYNDSEDYLNYLPSLTRQQIIENKTDILAITEFHSLLALFRDYKYAGSAVDAVNEALQEVYAGSFCGSDKWDMLQHVLSMVGIVSYTATVRGFSQSDWADVIAIATPEWLEFCGLEHFEPEAIEKDLRQQIKLFGQWAFGEVYGYKVENSEGDDIGSCWGFFGMDFDKSGLLEDAKSDIDCHIRQQRRQRLERLKRCIKNRVPLLKRAEIIGGTI